MLVSGVQQSDKHIYIRAHTEIQYLVITCNGKESDALKVITRYCVCIYILFSDSFPLWVMTRY